MLHKTRILIVVDMQRDFVDGSLNNEATKAMVPRLMEKIRNFDGEQIIFTRDTHGDDYLYTKEGQNLPVKHCVRGTEGWSLIPEIADFVKENLTTGKYMVTIVDKPTFGSVARDENDNSLVSLVAHLLNGHENAEIEIVGTCTGICVVSNALILKAFFYDKADIIVDASCCTCISEETHQAALTTMECCQIKVINR